MTRKILFAGIASAIIGMVIAYETAVLWHYSGVLP